jgi:hypothetical protein
MMLQPISLREARAFVDRHHRHHCAPQGGLFAIAVVDENRGKVVLGRMMPDLIGVAIVGRPVSRHLQDGFTAEVTRLCVLEGFPNACSMLYSAAKRAAQALGYRRVITYILASERGGSLRGAGWQPIRMTRAESWNRPARARVDLHPTEQKQLWQA